MLHPFFLKNLELKDINPRICGTSNCESGDIFPWHYIDRHVLHYVTRGCGRYLVNGREHAVREGDIFVSHADYYVRYEADAADPFSYIWVSFECSGSFAELLTADVFHAPWAGPIFARMIGGCETAAPEWAVCSCLYDFFVQLSQRQGQRPVHTEDYVSRAVNYIETNYAGSIHVAELAAALGLNRSYFSRIFRRHTGVSPQEYLVSFRLEKAAELMTRRGLSQKEAANQAGYPDICTFSRMFRKQYGMSPGAYIRKHSPGQAKNAPADI